MSVFFFAPTKCGDKTLQVAIDAPSNAVPSFDGPFPWYRKAADGAREMLGINLNAALYRTYCDVPSRNKRHFMRGNLADYARTEAYALVERDGVSHRFGKANVEQSLPTHFGQGVHNIPPSRCCMLEVTFLFFFLRMMRWLWFYLFISLIDGNRSNDVGVKTSQSSSAW